VRRRKKPAPSTAADIADEAPEPSNSMFGTSGGQSVDTNNSIFNSSFTPSASLLDTNEVDPVAEADVYIAYGREAQAIEILKEALRNHPERNALRVKLLEIYASQKDVHAFDLLASELFSLTKGEGEDWVYVAGLGVAIDPGNPLYAGGELSEELLAQPASLQTSVTRPAAELDPDFRLGAPRAEQVAPQDAALQITPEQLAAPDLPLDLAPAAEAAASDALDFDLGGKTVETAPPVEAPKPMADAGLDFAMPEPAATSAASLRPTEQAPESVPSLGFDLGDLNVEPADQGATPAVEVKELGNEALEYLADFKPSPVAGTQSPLDIAAASMPAAKDSPAEASATAGTEAVDFSDAPSAGGTDAVQAAPVTSSFDFGSINLDLAPHQPQEQDMTPSVKPDIAPPNESVPQAVVAPAAGSNDAEMNTKIDLADAYLGIGDKEGARELLEEVIQEGSGELVERAKAALAKIS
ncbi:MAG: FimV/HubP family polar landmark protein, partial [Burkholderiaceae bacterium]|nr:FimV/HubP family polar landmark protein [Burkholderiaceae bacterium]